MGKTKLKKIKFNGSKWRYVICLNCLKKFNQDDYIVLKSLESGFCSECKKEID